MVGIVPTAATPTPAPSPSSPPLKHQKSQPAMFVNKGMFELKNRFNSLMVDDQDNDDDLADNPLATMLCLL